MMRHRADQLVLQSTLLELRLDSLEDPAAGLLELTPWISELTSQHPVILLATCRSLRSGGQYRRDVACELSILLGAASAGCQLVDLSLESAEEMGTLEIGQAFAALRSAGARILLSFHDFQGTRDLNEVFRRLNGFPADLFKIVPTATSLAESLDLLSALRSAPSRTPSVAISMGEDGLLTRVLGLQFGSAFTFAAGSADEGTAPGQLTAETMQQLYRVGQHTAHTPIYAVAGDPVRSSLSPRMHNTAFQISGLDAVYVPLRTHDPQELMRAARDLPLQGFSITMPLKQAILPYLDVVDPLAARIGAVNTIRRLPDGSFEGYNTDAAGIVEPLAARLNLQGAQILVLGAGGAARAAVFGCLERGAQVSIANRTPAAAEALAAESGARAVPLDSLERLDVDVMIQATPAGMHGHLTACPLRAEQIRADILFDLVYNPLETPLIGLARQLGKAVIPGVEMFVHQGAAQFELWTGKPAPVAEMRAAVLATLHQRSQAGA